LVQLDEVVQTVVFFLDPKSPSRTTLEICGPERQSFNDVVAGYRRWFGWAPAYPIDMPPALAKLPYIVGDFLGWLGWRPPIRSNARLEMTRGAMGDPEPWMRLTGIRPRTLSGGLAARPPSVQERWFAQLYFTKFLVFLTLVLFWVGTGLVSLGPGFDVGMAYMRAAGIEQAAPIGIVLGAIADLAIGIGIAFRRTCRIALYGALAISAFYAIAGTILLPSLWFDPLGPMLKIWPIMALIVVALAIRKDR
jgi:DoxX-like family